VLAYAKVLGERNGKGFFGTMKSCGRYRKKVIFGTLKYYYKFV